MANSATVCPSFNAVGRRRGMRQRAVPGHGRHLSHPHSGSLSALPSASKDSTTAPLTVQASAPAPASTRGATHPVHARSGRGTTGTSGARHRRARTGATTVLLPQAHYLPAPGAPDELRCVYCAHVVHEVTPARLFDHILACQRAPVVLREVVRAVLEEAASSDMAAVADAAPAPAQATTARSERAAARRGTRAARVSTCAAVGKAGLARSGGGGGRAQSEMARQTRKRRSPGSAVATPGRERWQAPRRTTRASDRKPKRARKARTFFVSYTAGSTSDDGSA